MWFNNEECVEVIKNRWLKSKNDTDIAMVRTLKYLSKDLMKWNKTKFGNVKRSISETRSEIERIRSLEPNDTNILAELDLTKKCENLLDREENVKATTIKEIWTKGDKNTKYFHSSTIHKRKIE